MVVSEEQVAPLLLPSDSHRIFFFFYHGRIMSILSVTSYFPVVCYLTVHFHLPHHLILFQILYLFQQHSSINRESLILFLSMAILPSPTSLFWSTNHLLLFHINNIVLYTMMTGWASDFLSLTCHSFAEIWWKVNRDVFLLFCNLRAHFFGSYKRRIMLSNKYIRFQDVYISCLFFWHKWL